MNAELLQKLLMVVAEAGIQIANRHLVAAGQPPLTDEQVAAEKARQFLLAHSEINAWFDGKGLPRPE